MSNLLFDANRACEACELRKDCLGPVPAEGPMDAEIAFIGEAPGRNEDKTGKPFRGQAGQYFDSLLRSVEINRQDVWVTNTTKCRPVDNRTPTPEEVEICASRWLDVELQMVRPKIVVPMGDAAITHFLGEGTVYERHGIPIGVLQGSGSNGSVSVVSKEGTEVHSQQGTQPQTVILPIYHPAAGLHRPELMVQIQEDFQVLKEVISGEWEPTVDQFPEPYYSNTMNAWFEHNVVALDSEWVDNKLWSIQISGAPGTGSFMDCSTSKNTRVDFDQVIVHNYLADAEFVDLPEDTRDTMLMAYLLGLPQGLKELAKRLCGMEMKSYAEMVQPYGKEKAMAYLEEAARGNGHDYKGEWPDPPDLEDFTWNKKTNTLGVKIKKPQHISKKIKRILADVRGGKVLKDGPVDPYHRWYKIDSREREAVEAVLGHLPEGNLEDVPREASVYYSCRDADATLRVHNVLWPRILAKGLAGVFSIDMGTLPIALEMQRNGIKIDADGLRRLSREYEVLMQEGAEEIFLATGITEENQTGMEQIKEPWRFNPNSDNELRRLFFTELGFKPTKFTKTKLPSVANEELAKIDHPLVKMVEEYRHVQHLKDSFCDTLPSKANRDSRVHPTIRTTRTATGRWSMADPNCQQIPTRTDLGRAIRKQFIAEDGNQLVSIDYSQIELRVAAHLSQCKTMMEAFRLGQDIHTETAARLFGVQEPTEKQRYAAKTLNFGVIYGITADGFQAQMEVEGLRWTVDECGLFIKESNALRPELWVWQEETKAFARRNGYVMDMFGRRRLIPEILCPIKYIQSSGERETINMPVQGSAQGILKLAMGKLWRESDQPKPHYTAPAGVHHGTSKWLLQIHDELVWETHERVVVDFIEWAIPIMENIVQLSVPVIAEAKTGLNWGEMPKWTA